jgi:hypothetical protein
MSIFGKLRSLFGAQGIQAWGPGGPPKIKHPGLFHKETGTPAGKKIPEAKIQQKLHSPDPKVRQRAQFAENAKHWHHHGGAATQSHSSHGAASHWR